MSASSLLSPILNFQSFLKMSHSYLKKMNPIQAIYLGLLGYVTNLLTANKRLKAVQNRVNHLNYRVNQMEQLIYENNQFNHSKGRTLNQLR